MSESADTEKETVFVEFHFRGGGWSCVEMAKDGWREIYHRSITNRLEGIWRFGFPDPTDFVRMDDVVSIHLIKETE